MDISASQKPQLLDITSTALYIIDMQERLLNAMPSIQQAHLTQTIHFLLTSLEILGAPLIQLFQQNPEKLGNYPQLLQPYTMKYPLIRKEYFSCLGGKDQSIRQNDLEERKITTVILTGVESHICVLQTAESLLRLGYSVILPQDATLSIQSREYHIAIEEMRWIGCRITSSESLIFSLLQRCTSPHFPSILRAVKSWRSHLSNT